MSGGVGKRSPPPEAEAVGPVPKKAAWEQTNTVFTNEKGGMVGYDKDQVKKIIYEMSKVSSPLGTTEEPICYALLSVYIKVCLTTFVGTGFTSF